MNPQEEIKTLRSKGVPDGRIVEYYTDKLTKAKVPQDAIDSWMEAKGLYGDMKKVHMPNLQLTSPSPFGNEVSEQPRPLNPATGQPIPTPLVNSKVLQTALPIIGDIAGTYAMPQLKGPQLAGKALNVLLRAGGSAGGSAIGSIIGQGVERGKVNFDDVKNEALMGAAGEGIIAPVAGLLGKMKKPALEVASDVTFMGSAAKDWLRRRYMNDVTEKSRKFTEDILGFKPMLKEDAGVRYGDELSKLKDFKTTYEDFNKMVKTASDLYDGQLPLVQTDIWVKERLRGYEKSGLSPKMAQQRFLDDLGLSGRDKKTMQRFIRDQGIVDDSDFRYLYNTLWNPSKNDPAVTKKLKDTLKTNIIGDIGDISGAGRDTAKQVREAADTVFANTQKWFKDNPQAARALDPSGFSHGTRKYYEDYPERIVDDLFSKTNPEQVLDIKTQMLKTEEGKEAWAGIEFNWIKDMFERNMNQVPGSGARMLKPEAVANEILGNEKLLKSVMPDAWPKLKNEADRLLKIAKEFETGANRMVTGPGSVISRGLGGTAASWAFGAAGFPIAETVGVVSAFELMSPSFQKYIGGMIKTSTKSAAKAAVHLSGQGIIKSIEGNKEK